MSKSGNKAAARLSSGVVEIKSKFDAEYRRIGVNRQKLPGFQSFFETIREMHQLHSILFTIWYTDPEGDLLPISNSEHFARALMTAKPLLRLVIQRKGQAIDPDTYGTAQKKQKFGVSHHPRLAISFPEDFRRVSAIIDVDIVPECHRRVKLMKNSSDKPLGFYIRDGTSIRVLPHGLEKVPGVFISRLVAGGLAESTGLLAVNDEVLEVNGIEVSGKSLDQVTDMMVANSSNLIVTIKPVNNHNNIKSRPDATSLSSHGSHKSGFSSRRSESCEALQNGDEGVEEDEDVVEDHTLLAEDGTETPAQKIQSKPRTGKSETGVITL